MIIGLTGTIGSGKSTAAAIFEKHGFRRIDADKIGHKLLEKGTRQYNEILQYFGQKILGEKGDIDRTKLGDCAFREKKSYRALNKIMLDSIIGEIKNHIINSTNKNIVIDAPLLLETKAKDLVELVVVVKTSPPNILKRNKKFSKERINKVKSLQMGLTDKLKHADYVINNDGNMGNLENQVLNIIKRLGRQTVKKA
jgi:dephospho-CoA kinase